MPSTPSSFLELTFRNPTRPRLDIECLTLSELRRRMRPAFFSRVQRPRFHLLALYTAGEAVQEIDFQRRLALPGTVLHVKPGQVIRYVSPERAEASLILFTPEFLSRDAVGLAMPDAVTLAPDARGAVDASVHALFEEYARHDDGRSVAILRHQLSALLLQLDRAHGGPEAETDADLYRGFRHALEGAVLATRRVEDYARMLGCSPRTLHRVALAATGHGAKALIDERVALEAKRLLAHTGLGVGAIAHQLGFSEPTNFVKFFRRVTGTLPGAFRDAATPANRSGGVDGTRRSGI